MAFDPNDADTKAALAKAIEEAVAGLQTKNTELLAKLKKAQKDSTISPEDHAALQAEFEQTQAKLTEATKLAKAATTEAEKIKRAYETESKVAHNLLVENGLTQALVAAKVKPELMKAAKAMLSGSVVLTADGENRVAKIGDKPLADAVTEWAKSDEGKHFVTAPANGGGGANGGGHPDNHGDLAKITDPNARLAAINATGAKT